MTALPATAKFIDHKKVYFPYNEIVKTESMETLDYLKMFFPFQMPDIKSGALVLYGMEIETMTNICSRY